MLPSIAVALTLLLSLGCATGKQAQRTDQKESANLGARSEDFWNNLRWQYPEAAAGAIEDELARRRWGIEAERLMGAQRITDAMLINLSLDPTPEEGARTATVQVRMEFYTLPDQVLRKETVTQTWYRGKNTWYLQWEDGNPLTGEDW